MANLIQFLEENLMRIDGKGMSFENDVICQLRLQTLRVMVIVIILVSMLNIFGISGPKIFLTNNLLYVLCTLGIYMLARMRLVTVLSALTLIFLITASYLSGEIIYISLHPTDYSISLIWAIFFLYSSLLCVSIMTYMPIITLISDVLGSISYTLAYIMLDSTALKEMLPILVLLYTMTGCLSILLKRSTKKILLENNMFRDNEKELLDFFHMDRDQILDYIQLAKRKNLSPEEIGLFLSSFGQDAAANIVGYVNQLAHQEQTTNKILDEKIPGLTPTEKEIVRAIMSGLRLGEICSRLGKSKTNVCATRSHIRKKMGLTPDDDLYEKLRERLL